MALLGGLIGALLCLAVSIIVLAVLAQVALVLWEAGKCARWVLRATSLGMHAAAELLRGR